MRAKAASAVASVDAIAAVPVGPAAQVPVPSPVGVVLGHGDDVAHPGLDVVLAAGAQVALHRLERMDAPHLDLVVGPHRGQPNRAQATSSAVTTQAATTNTTSVARCCCGRNGLRPTP